MKTIRAIFRDGTFKPLEGVNGGRKWGHYQSRSARRSRLSGSGKGDGQRKRGRSYFSGQRKRGHSNPVRHAVRARRRVRRLGAVRRFVLLGSGKGGQRKRGHSYFSEIRNVPNPVRPGDCT